MRIGIGYDVHRLKRGRRLFLGGVEFEKAEFGLEGHSDADVLIHAIMDAMLGAAGLPDIGHFFPDKDEKYRGIRSTELLKQVKEEIQKQGYELSNIDTIVVAEYPKLAPQIAAIKESLAAVLGVSASQIGVKATTEEGLGFTGAKEGVAAHAVALLKERKPNSR
ncbi:MAG TPA: 2-C-methyl-D-erythritol 2,4-cyclodiphosphate synthase [Candidatus Goldiibacteriota bacterium]|nr:2-C-methyl-D-erythritol 2,4-cyclodiphosphate synthase [Candidatus Goldiibacteriota bacterium]